MDRTTKDYLKAYGYGIEDNEGGLVRLDGRQNVRDKWIADGDGWRYFEKRDDAWFPVKHSVNPDGSENMVWPDADVHKVYRTAVEAREGASTG